MGVPYVCVLFVKFKGLKPFSEVTEMIKLYGVIKLKTELCMLLDICSSVYSSP